MSKLTERGERLLLQALKQSNIDEPNETNQFPGFLAKESVYWQRVGDDIEIVFNSAHWFTARLKEDERQSLHTQYDVLHKIAKTAKKDYNLTLKRFAKSRAAKGYSRREWRNHWRKHVAENYPDELMKDFLELFAHSDSPSASEIASFKLSKYTGHKKSYLPRLVTASRNAAKKRTIKSTE